MICGQDELAKLNKEIEDRHTAELKSLESHNQPQPASSTTLLSSSAPNSASAAAAVIPKELEDVSISDEAKPKSSKAMKRREKLEKEEVYGAVFYSIHTTSNNALFHSHKAERQARIAEEAANMGPRNRLIEEEGLKKLLSPIGLRMKDIKARGRGGEGMLISRISLPCSENRGEKAYLRLEL